MILFRSSRLMHSCAFRVGTSILKSELLSLNFQWCWPISGGCRSWETIKNSKKYSSRLFYRSYQMWSVGSSNLLLWRICRSQLSYGVYLMMSSRVNLRYDVIVDFQGLYVTILYHDVIIDFGCWPQKEFENRHDNTDVVVMIDSVVTAVCILGTALVPYCIGRV